MNIKELIEIGMINATGTGKLCKCDICSPYRPQGICAPMQPIGWCVRCGRPETQEQLNALTAKG